MMTRRKSPMEQEKPKAIKLSKCRNFKCDLNYEFSLKGSGRNPHSDRVNNDTETVP